MKKHSFRCFKHSWGIAVDISADIKAANISSLMVIPIVSYEEKEQLYRAMKLSSLASVIIYEIDYNPTDYQVEGLACCLMEMIAEELGEKKPEIDISFNGRYVFNFKGEEK